MLEESYEKMLLFSCHILIELYICILESPAALLQARGGKLANECFEIIFEYKFFSM